MAIGGSRWPNHKESLMNIVWIIIVVFAVIGLIAVLRGRV